ncbi:MAG: 50S ribosomal protein L21 [Gammaproteobacteria bacterium RIFCSPHIGHO2_12_FULL_35_23]|nr:MAG: 50S ribosomal protein L21 [Gammaproteobacteria bacterium RIFCSPHIGHO2_12_FULL_35_23]
MYAIIKTGGKQYKVTAGQSLKIEKLALEPGSKVDFEEVLLVAKDDDIKVGTPFIKGIKVSAEVIEHGRAKKIKIIKLKRRKHHMKRQGHRQDYTAVKIINIK